MIAKKRNGAFTELQFQNLVVEFIRSYDKLYDRNKRMAKDKNYAKSIFLNETLDAKIKEIQGKEPFYSFLQIITREDALTQASRFEIMQNFCIKNKYSIDEMAVGIAEYEAIFAIYSAIASDNEHEINGGYIFGCLEENWKGFSREFLLSFGNALKKILIEKDIFTVKQMSKDEHPKLQDYYYNRYPRHLTEALDIENFPFPYYFLRDYRQSKIVSDEELIKSINIPLKDKASRKTKPFITIGVVEYSSKCIITRFDTDDFDLFFALQFYFTDIMKSNEFLHYQLEDNFEGDIQNYKWFLENLMWKYDYILKENHKNVIQRFIEENKQTNKSKENSTISKTQRIFAIKFLLEAFAEQLNAKEKINDVAIAKFADFIIEGRNSENAKNTYTYKAINLFYNKSKKMKREDLQSIRQFFIDTKISFQPLLDAVDLQISTEQSRPTKN